MREEDVRRVGGPVNEDERFELQTSQLRTALDFLREGIQILASDWRYIYVNEAVVRHGLRPRSELLGRTMLECYPGIGESHMFSVLDDCMRRRVPAQLENEFEYPDGRRSWFELRIEPCGDGLIVLSLDVTERKRMEATLEQSHKLRALGQMASSIAHDLNNILAPITLQVQLLRRELGPDESSDEMLELIEAAVRTGADTVARLRNFSRQEPDPRAEPTDPDQMAELARQICLPRLREHPNVRLVRTPAPTPRVLVRPSELVNAIVNLIVNALEALAGKGTITLRTGSDPDEGYVWIEVADDGPGMPPDLERRAVEPFFTTKALGTGLGLAMVYACAHRYGGRLDIDTRPGRGTVVRLSFPTTDVVAARTSAANRPTLGRLLVVDDEPGTRLVLETLLEEEGFTVETASNAADALEKAFAFEPDLMLADYQLPDLDGVALSRRVREERRDLPVLIMSAFDDTHGEVAALLREPRTEHILKPIELEQLMTRLTRMLEAS